MKHSYYSSGSLWFVLMLLTACSGSSSSGLSSLPDTSPVPLHKPVYAPEAAASEAAGVPTPLPGKTEKPPVAKTDPKPPIKQPDPAPGSEEKPIVRESKPPCNDNHRATIASMEKNISEAAVYYATLPEESLERHDVWLDLQEAKADLKKYKRNNNCD